MELTPKVLTTVEFTEKRRGYDQQEVRAFLLEVARAMDGLQARVREAERAAEVARSAPAPASAPATPAPPASAPGASSEESAEQARRTLVLAQRTADAAIAEARADAERVRADADAEGRDVTERAAALAERALREAQARAEQIVVEAHARARDDSESIRSELRTEIGGLTEARDARRDDVERLEAFLESQHERVRTSVDALQHILDHPGALRRDVVPADTEVAIPDPTPVRSTTVDAGPDVDAAAPVTEPAEVEPSGGLVDDGDVDALTWAAPAGDRDDGDPTVAIPATAMAPERDPEPARRDPAPDGRHDPLIEPEPTDGFTDEQLVRSFFDPGQGEGRRRRRRG